MKWKTFKYNKINNNNKNIISIKQNKFEKCNIENS